MNVSKTAATVGIGAAIVAGSMLAVSAANAQSENANGDNRAGEFAERFNLEEGEVKQYFEEKHEQRHEDREAKHAEHLATLVSDGALTQEQADALSAKKDEMHEAREGLRDQDLTREEMKEQMMQSKDEFKVWAEEQGIDLEALRGEKGEGGEGHHKGMRGGFGQ